MKNLNKSSILILLGCCGFLLALFIPKLINSFLISVATMIPIVAVSLACLLQGCYDLLRLVYQQIKQKKYQRK